jgi:hypothetical protein
VLGNTFGSLAVALVAALLEAGIVRAGGRRGV